MEEFGDGSSMTGEVALGALGNTTATPGDQNMLGKTSIGVLDFDKGKLDAAFVEFLDEFTELTVYADESAWLADGRTSGRVTRKAKAKMCYCPVRCLDTHLRCSQP